MKREDWLFDEMYAYDLLFDSDGKLKHDIVDGKIKYEYYYKKRLYTREIEYNKLLSGHQAHINLDIKPGDIVRSISNTQLETPIIEEWIVITPTFGYYPNVIVLRHINNNVNISINSDYIDLNSNYQIFRNFERNYNVYLKEDKYLETIKNLKNRYYENKMYNILESMKSLTKAEQQKIISQL